MADRGRQYGGILVECQLDVAGVDGRMVGKSTLGDASCRLRRRARVFLPAVQLVHAVGGEAKRGEGGLGVR